MLTISYQQGGSYEQGLPLPHDARQVREAPALQARLHGQGPSDLQVALQRLRSRPANPQTQPPPLYHRRLGAFFIHSKVIN